MKEIEKVYDPKKVEEKWYQFWLEGDYFHAEPNPSKQPYTIVIPPPNVTDVLHMGHALNNTIQDILIRFKRMQGFETLWLPGTDHAGIATQNVVERNLQKEGLTRHDLGREKFVERVWEWKERAGSTIIEQLKRLGCSCDWARERFTLDEGLSKAVIEVFVRLYEKGLIYRGQYIINWCPRCQTAISDEEVEHKEYQGSLWYIQYPLKDSKKRITVATTRPETMLGDVAVAVHPKDPRYKGLIGKIAILPIMEREIPIIADELVDPKFGTGAVKVTPAHDPVDFEIGKKHNLKPICVMNGDGRMNENAGKYQGFDRFKCRKALVAELKSRGLLKKIEKHDYAVGHCHRCHTIIEPYLSEQWFVHMKPLAEPALRVVREGRLKFHPERWTKVYISWMENIRDWCISRQLWWGHQIPVYYCEDCNHQMVKREKPQICDKCGSTKIRQDEDVLDTWFSSWLWPFSTMGWPEETDELKYFYPTDTLVTGPDIIFFWVARMIMAGLEFMGDIPFKDVYIHGIIRDEQGRKMSKSLGNCIDPLEMIERFSADSVRFSLIMLTSEGQDISLTESKFEMGRNFSNKIWNAYRFLAMNLEGDYQVDLNSLLQEKEIELADRWIISRYNATIRQVTQSLERFQFNEALNAFYSFFWHDYCDWYLELIKPRLYRSGDKRSREIALGCASAIMKGSMKLLHPFMPFITEEIWQNLKTREEESLVISEWPKWDEGAIDEVSQERMSLIQEVIRAIRNIRGEMNVPPNKRADVYIKGADAELMEILKGNQGYLENLAKVGNLILDREMEKPRFSASAVVRGLEIFVPLEGLIDIQTERARLTKEVTRIERQLVSLNQKLNNQDFLQKAPKEVVEREKRRKEEYEMTLEKLQKNLASLEE